MALNLKLQEKLREMGTQRYVHPLVVVKEFYCGASIDDLADKYGESSGHIEDIIRDRSEWLPDDGCPDDLLIDDLPSGINPMPFNADMTHSTTGWTVEDEEKQ